MYNFLRRQLSLNVMHFILEWDGLQELEVAMVCIPVSQLVDLVTVGVNKASELAPTSSGAPSPSVEGWWAPSALRPALKRACHAPSATTSVALKEEELTMWEAPLSMGPLRPLLTPWELSAPCSTAGGTSHPLPYPSTHFTARSFKQVNTKGFRKVYICQWCKKYTSNWDSMVSHCLQEHLGVHLVCPQCRMCYLDPLRFCLYGRGIHNLLFY